MAQGFGTKRRVSAAVRDGKDGQSLERALRDLKRKLKKRRRKSTSGDELG